MTLCQWCNKNVANGTGLICPSCLQGGVITVAPPEPNARRMMMCFDACDGFNPAVMRELAEHCLRDQIGSDAWNNELDTIIERLRT